MYTINEQVFVSYIIAIVLSNLHYLYFLLLYKVLRLSINFLYYLHLMLSRSKIHNYFNMNRAIYHVGRYFCGVKFSQISQQILFCKILCTMWLTGARVESTQINTVFKLFAKNYFPALCGVQR